MTRDYAFRALRRVRDELEAARFAIARTLASWDGDRSAQKHFGAVSSTELRRCAQNLEMTFLLRLFGEFEGVLRDYWEHGLNRKTEPKMFHLIEGIAHSHSMSAIDLAAAHDVRTYRNDIIHDNMRDARLDFQSCLRAMGKYLRWLPIDW